MAAAKVVSWRSGAFIALAAAGLAVSCRGEQPVAPHAAAMPPTSNPLDAGARTTFEVPVLHVVLDDPRVAAARERERAKDYVMAARAFDDARKTLPPSAADACAWKYEAGRLHLLAGDLPEAAAAFDEVAAADVDGGSSSCALADYARLRAAQAYSRSGRADDAIARARAANDRIAADDEVKVVLAEALATKGDTAAAIPIWRALLAANARGVRWVDTSVHLANALLDAKAGDPSANAKEAFDLATRVIVGAPRFASSIGADAARGRAYEILRHDPHADDPVLTNDEKVQRAQAWLDGNDAPKALEEANAILQDAKKPPHEIACRASIVRAQATPKKKNDAWTLAIAQCEHEDALVTALFSGAKASVQEKKYDEAIARYAQIERLFPDHRYADDARFHAALLVQDTGDQARALAMLSSLPDMYAQGDMRKEALFRVALAHLTKSEWEEGKAPLDRILALDPNDRHWASAGRAAYFRAKAAEMTGDAKDADARYAQIVREVPLSFYMARAYAKLAAHDATKAKKILDDAIASDADGMFPSRDHAELHTAAFERAKALLEVGEIEFAKREFAKVPTDANDDDEVGWIEALLYERSGAPEIACANVRKKSDYLAHYPSGRWRALWEIAFPRVFEPLVVQASDARGIPAALTWAIMREESGFFAEAKSGSNAFGLMQLIAPTAKWVAAGTGLATDEQSLKTPEVSIALGAKLLASLRGTFTTNPAFAIAAYNSGGGAVSHWINARPTNDFDVWVENIPYEETRGYVKRVLASQAAYAYLYARPRLEEVLSIPLTVVP